MKLYSKGGGKAIASPTLTEMTRQAIDIGIRELEREDEFTRHARALEAAGKPRAKILAHNGGKPLDIDPAEDLRKMREERIE